MGSGYFYNDPHVGKKGKIGSRKRRFIEAARMALEPTPHAVASPSP